MKDLARKAGKYWKIFLQFQKIRLMIRMAYSVNFFVMAVSVLFQMVFSIVFIKVVFGFIGNLAGWGYYQALLVVATYMLVEGLMWVLCAYMSVVEQKIKDGSFDNIITKPVDSQILVSIWRGDLEDSVRLVSGIGIILYALNHLNLGLMYLLSVLPFYLLLLVGAFFIIYSLTLIFRTVSFWTIESGALFSLGDALTKMSQYPTDIIYHAVVRMILMTIIPIAFMATVPAKILAYGLDWKLIIAAISVAIFFVWISRQFWLFSLKHYSSASS